VIADFKVTEKMLNYFIQKAHNRKMLVHPRIVIGVPRRSRRWKSARFMDSAYRAKASEVAPGGAGHGGGNGAGPADYGAELQHGGGYWRSTTDIAGDFAERASFTRVRCGWRGTRWTEAIMNISERKYNLLIPASARLQQIKMEDRLRHQLDKPMTMEIKGAI